MERTLNDFKVEYAVLQSLYKLPTFDDMNKEFHIETVYESESDLLLKKLSALISDKFNYWLNFIEVFLNPQSPGLFFITAMKNVTSAEKEKLAKIYTIISKDQWRYLKMQFNSQDKEYAEYIKDSYVLWIEIKRQLAPIIDVIAKDGKIPSKESGDRNYFG